MGELSSLPNISKVIEGKLNAAGISSPAQLRGLGSKAAFARLHLDDPGACLNMLCALEGAIAGLSWHNLPTDKKAELREFHKSL